eukprot:UN11511
MFILSTQKLKNGNYRFGYTKMGKRLNPTRFLIRNHQIVGSFICDFCLKMSKTLIFLGGWVRS